jgi:hypothetical protein
MVEVHDESYGAVSNGYREVGPLRDHLLNSSVAVGRAVHNHTSRTTFELHEIPVETPLFVLYVSPAVGFLL